MDSRTFQRLSLRTVPAHMAFWQAKSDAERDSARKAFLCNCALGMAGEAAEIADTPTSDEIGDGYWYVYVLFFALQIEDYEPQPRLNSEGPGIHRSAGAVCELVKKHAFHGREFEDVRERLAEHARRYADALATLDGQPPSQTFAQNVAKLEARYPKGFFERG